VIIARLVRVPVQQKIRIFTEQPLHFTLQVPVRERDGPRFGGQQTGGMIVDDAQVLGISAKHFVIKITIAEHQPRRPAEQFIDHALIAYITQMDQKIHAGMIERRDGAGGRVGPTMGIR